MCRMFYDETADSDFIINKWSPNDSALIINKWSPKNKTYIFDFDLSRSKFCHWRYSSLFHCLVPHPPSSKHLKFKRRMLNFMYIHHKENQLLKSLKGECLVLCIYSQEKSTSSKYLKV